MVLLADAGGGVVNAKNAPIATTAKPAAAKPAPKPAVSPPIAYNPGAYVPGGASAAVAKAIQAKGVLEPGPKPVAVPVIVATEAGVPIAATTPFEGPPLPTTITPTLKPPPPPPPAKPGGPFDHAQLETLWTDAGGPQEAADVAAAIAQAESSGNPASVDNTAYAALPGFHEPPSGASREYSVGLWQVNLLAHPSYTAAQMLVPLLNARAAVAISNDGTDFGAWSTYTNGAYRDHLGNALSGTAPTLGGASLAPQTQSAPAGVQKAWAALINVYAKDPARQRTAVESAVASIKDVMR